MLISCLVLNLDSLILIDLVDPVVVIEMECDIREASVIGDALAEVSLVDRLGVALFNRVIALALLVLSVILASRLTGVSWKLSSERL